MSKDRPDAATVPAGAGASGADEFAGTARFAVRRRLGAGGMGVVYEAWDRERQAAVALKTLRELEPAAIYRLKREFRSIADVAHPNLVSLHQLFSEGPRWFFTMELVRGIDFLAWVRPGGAQQATPDVTLKITATSEDQPAPPQAPRPAARPGLLDPQRLREALRQLAEAIATLHGAGRLHRDLKPSNVLVEHDGRVVVLDFGLATELDAAAGERSTSQAIAGTPIYMAPEQAAMEAVGPPADWYALGVMIYEALTGRPPFLGSQLQVLMDKQRGQPLPPEQLSPEAPRDLCALSSALLRRDPAERPQASQVLRRLGAHSPQVALAPASVRAAGLVGQQRVLAVLREALAGVRQGRAATVVLSGRPGAGTTAVARAFAEEAERDAGAVVLSGRCYEQESVPYKALDSLIDSLSRHLLRLPRLEAEALLPRDTAALVRMFPVLSRVEAVAAAARRGAETPDQQELRKRAAASLREVLGRVADRRPLVLVIDGLQWSDSDSLDLLADLLRAPDPPSLLLVACLRVTSAEPVSDMTPARGQRAWRQQEPLGRLRARLGTLREVEVQPLTEPEALDLAGQLLERAGLPMAHAPVVAHESRGNPFLAYEMVRVLQLGGSRPALSPGITLESAIGLRVAQLPDAARRLLEAAAVSGRPTTAAVLVRAAAVEDGGPLFSLLRAAHLIASADDGERVEPYHDRIRDVVLAAIGEERLRRIHERLAEGMEVLPGAANPAALARHYRSAGLPARAAECAEEAAARAAGALAFHRAVRYYRLALSLREPDAQWGRTVEARLGDALANAGHGAEAAAVYLSAAARSWATRAEAIELRRCAAEQYLRAGRVDEGVGVLREVLASHGIGFASTPRRALVSLLGRRALLRLRGTGFTPRDSSQVSGEELARIDVCWAGAVGLGMVDIIRGAAFQAQHLLLALRAGEPVRVARALAAEAPFVAVPGGERAQRRARALVQRAHRLGDELGHPHTIALAGLMGALVDFLGGNWRRTLEQADRAAALFRNTCSGVAWEVSNSQLYSLWSLFYLGELGELRRRVGALLGEARSRGDLYAVTSLRTGLTNVAFLVDDDVAGARREVADVLQQWSHQGFHFQHYWSLLAQGLTDLYAGDGAAAHARIERQWPALSASLMLRTESVRIEAINLRARSALAALEGSAGDRGRLSVVEGHARELRRIRTPWSQALAVLLEAGLHRARGRTGPAIASFAEASRRLERLDMALFAVAARRRAAELRGGGEGQAEVAEADTAFSAQGVRNPGRMAALLAP